MANPRNDQALLDAQHADETDQRAAEVPYYVNLTQAEWEGHFRCKHHPEREAVEPIAFRLCADCHADAQASHADDTTRRYTSREPYAFINGEYSETRTREVTWEDK